MGRFIQIPLPHPPLLSITPAPPIPPPPYNPPPAYNLPNQVQYTLSPDVGTHTVIHTDASGQATIFSYPGPNIQGYTGGVYVFTFPQQTFGDHRVNVTADLNAAQEFILSGGTVIVQADPLDLPMSVPGPVGDI